MKFFIVILAIAGITCQAQELNFINSVEVEERIVGGEFAEEGQFPHQVALFRDNRFSCGGSIVGERFVLTAAHCVYDSNGRLIPTRSLTVLSGSTNLENGTFHSVRRISPHHQYGNFENDIALLKISDKFEFDNFTQPIELSRNHVGPNTVVELSGWGRVGTEDEISFDLKFTTAHAVGEKKCREVTGVQNGILCLESADDEGVCFGDSGGPATANGKLVGVANFIVDECGTAHPDGYASVAYFYDWIVKRLK
ncbi:serine protease SP24D-like [Culicoides brevitarsis]|uniref:serine protease SP24D-like n=1 Tax=Culicoides brevitarsis TaxID=469753 RepID=UPI00307C58D6